MRNELPPDVGFDVPDWVFGLGILLLVVLIIVAILI